MEGPISCEHREKFPRFNGATTEEVVETWGNLLAQLPMCCFNGATTQKVVETVEYIRLDVLFGVLQWGHETISRGDGQNSDGY